ncbi:MAG: Mrp/NBP35 family ATP-binding protein [Bacteroidales bacterium]|nr:Mrp/NBP35 family ATP-binding protein [Bacteroidales bacterium]
MKQNIFEKIEMPHVKHIIVVASGKGGVGKSTVAANLAVSLAIQGYNIALVDADLYGPSIPMMFGVGDKKPEIHKIGDQDKIMPIKKYGVNLISIGFFINPEQSLIWRGPMAANGLTQLFRDTEWGNTDYMIVDFPPGTGDIQLTTLQKLNLSGAIIVTTPQQLAVSDARKATSMFLNPDLKVPLLGIVENMSWFTPVQHADEKYYIFGTGGGKQLATEFNTELLGQIPLMLEVGEAADKGVDILSGGSKDMITVFEQLSQKIVSNLKIEK